MPGQDTTAYNEVLKNVFEGGIRELIPTKVKTLRKFEEKDAKAWGGRYVEYPLLVGRNWGSGWGTELGNLPTAGREQYTNTKIFMRYQYGRIQLSAQVMKASQGSRNAFEPAMEQAMRGIVNTMSSERGRAIMGDGRGIMCLVNETTPSGNTTVVVDSPGGFAGADNGARFVNPGMVIGFVNPTTGALRASNRTVQSVATAGTSFVVDSAPAAATADNDYIVRVMTTGSTDVSDSSYQKEMMGLSGLIDDGTYVGTLHAVNRITYPIYQSTVITSAGAWSSDVIQRAIDLADQRGGGTINSLTMHHSGRRAYIASMDDLRRYSGADLSRPDGGTVAAKMGKLTFGGIPIDEEKYCPYGVVFGVDDSTFKRYVEVAGEWADEDGSILQRVGTGSTAQDAYEAFYRIWDNVTVEEPATCFRVDGLSVSLAVAHID